MASGRDHKQTEMLCDISAEDLERYADRHHISLPADPGTPSSETATELLTRVRALGSALDRLEAIEKSTVGPHTDSKRDPGRPPTKEEDPYHAIIRFCDVPGAEEGPLAGWRIGIKDNIAVAGIPMTRGNALSLARMPLHDAVVVQRLLDAGGRVIAKTNIDDAFGVALNPFNPLYSAGGSSSGSAVAVATGMADAALGADQGGSIRIPAAWCGLVGMKPTHGLVPTRGLCGWGNDLDHIGPLTRKVYDNAAILNVLAGANTRNPRRSGGHPPERDYTATLNRGVHGLRVGIVVDSLTPSGTTAANLDAFFTVLRSLERCGAELVDVSAPLWLDAFPIWLTVVTAGLVSMRESFGTGDSSSGTVEPTLAADSAVDYWSGTDRLPFGNYDLPILYERIREAGLGTHFARANHLRLELRRQIDGLLADVDLLVTPTTPAGPNKVSVESDNSGRLPEKQYRAVGGNTYPLNLSGHPALTVPSGTGDQRLPAGFQIIGPRFSEQTVYRLGFAAEAVAKST